MNRLFWIVADRGSSKLSWQPTDLGKPQQQVLFLLEDAGTFPHLLP